MQHDFAAAHAHVLQAIAECGPEDIEAGGGVVQPAGAGLSGGRPLRGCRQGLAQGDFGSQFTNDRTAVGFMTVQTRRGCSGLGDLGRCEELTQAGLASLTEDDHIPFCIGWTNLAEVRARRAGTRRAPAKLCAGWLAAAHLRTRRERIFLVAVAGLLLLDAPAERHRKRVEARVNTARLLAYVTATSERLGELAPLTQR